MLDYLTEASHVAIGMNIPFDEALNLVMEAKKWAEEPESTLTNVIYGVDFRRGARG